MELLGIVFGIAILYAMAKWKKVGDELIPPYESDWRLRSRPDHWNEP